MAFLSYLAHLPIIPLFRSKLRGNALFLIIIALVVLWLLGYLGPAPFRRGGNYIHILIVIALILVVFRLLR